MTYKVLVNIWGVLYYKKILNCWLSLIWELILFKFILCEFLTIYGTLVGQKVCLVL